MKYKQFFGWFTFDIAVFLVGNIFLVYFFQDRLSAIRSIDFLSLIVLGLAVFRIAHIISSEVITKPLRAPFVDETIEHGKVVEEPKKYGFLGAFGQLIYCPSCSGVWVATLFAYLYVFWPTQTFFVALLFALSAIERIISMALIYLKSARD